MVMPAAPGIILCASEDMDEFSEIFWLTANFVILDILPFVKLCYWRYVIYHRPPVMINDNIPLAANMMITRIIALKFYPYNNIIILSFYHFFAGSQTFITEPAGIQGTQST